MTSPRPLAGRSLPDRTTATPPNEGARRPSRLQCVDSPSLALPLPDPMLAAGNPSSATRCFPPLGWNAGASALPSSRSQRNPHRLDAPTGRSRTRAAGDARSRLRLGARGIPVQDEQPCQEAPGRTGVPRRWGWQPRLALRRDAGKAAGDSVGAEGVVSPARAIGTLPESGSCWLRSPMGPQPPLLNFATATANGGRVRLPGGVLRPDGPVGPLKTEPRCASTLGGGDSRRGSYFDGR